MKTSPVYRPCSQIKVERCGVSTLICSAAGDGFVMPSTATFILSPKKDGFPIVLVPRAHRMHEHSTGETQMAQVTFYFLGSAPADSLPQLFMLWNIGHPFQSIIEAGTDVASARQAMIEKIKADPGAFITKITPAEPSAKNLLDLGKAVFGMK